MNSCFRNSCTLTQIPRLLTGRTANVFVSNARFSTTRGNFSSFAVSARHVEARTPPSNRGKFRKISRRANSRGFKIKEKRTRKRDATPNRRNEIKSPGCGNRGRCIVRKVRAVEFRGPANFLHRLRPPG